MKKFLAICSFFLLTACSVGGVELTKNAVFCESDGKQFAPGEAVELVDGCNSCVCSVEGKLENCTEKDCEAAVGLANPAAVKCSVDGFTYEIRTDEAGGQFGVCIDEENKECIAWEYFREECVLGELKEPVVDEEKIDDEGEAEAEAVVCTMEAKICSDGSSVGRVQPDCEFAVCPNE